MVSLSLIALLSAGLLWIALEHIVARRRGDPRHSPAQIRSNLRCGALRLVAGAATHGGLMAAYHGLSQHALFELSLAAPSTWLIAFVLYDLAYYWEHRLSHRHGLLWTVHAVHHQATDFNLSVGFRSGVLAPLAAFPFFAPLAVLGVPVEAYAAALVASTSVLFFTHSRVIGRLGPLGGWINNPVAHRRHHAALGPDGGANFGGVLLVWDRLFGTYAAADPGVGCGLGDSKPPRSAWAANLQPIAAWLRAFGRTQLWHATQALTVYGLALACGWAALAAAPDPRLVLWLAAPTLAWGVVIGARRRGSQRRPFFERAWPAAARVAPLALPLVLGIALFEHRSLAASAAASAVLLALLLPTMARGRLDLASAVR